jgi:EmrB/QacA subfamily drug resistance transporter
VSRRQLLVSFSAVMLATLLAALDQTIVATALPQIVTDLHGFQHLSWVVTIYLLTSTVTVPLYGKLSDLYGRRTLFVVAISIFLVGSALCAVAQTMGQLIAFRALQGLGAGGLLPLSQATIADLFSPRDRGRYQGFIGAVWATAAIAGPLLGGTLTDSASWRWIFLINLPLGAAALVVVMRTLPPMTQRREHRIDYLGAVVLSVAVTCLLLASVWGGTTYAWDSAQVIGTAVAGLVGGVAFLAVERRAPEPLLPLTLFSQRIFAVSNGASMIVGAILFGVTIYIPVYVQGVLGETATGSGVVLIPLSLGWVAASFASGQIISRTGRYRVFPLIGSTLVLAGMLLLTGVGATTSRVVVSLDLVVIGIGMGTMFQTYVIATQNAVAISDLGVATASIQFFRSMGGSLGVAAFGALLANRLTDELPARLGAAAARVDPDRLLQGSTVPPALREGTAAALSASLHSLWVVAAVLAAIGLALALALEERPLRTHTAENEPMSSGAPARHRTDDAVPDSP